MYFVAVGPEGVMQRDVTKYMVVNIFGLMSELPLLNVYTQYKKINTNTSKQRVAHPWKPINPLSPHDALKHHFTSLETDLIFLQPRVLERKFHETGLPIHGNFLYISPTANHLHSLQVENCDSNSRLVVDEDDNG